jgi:hypothetical protein
LIRVLILSPSDDTGAVGVSIKGAFDRHSEDILVRAVRNTDNYARHPYDVQNWFNNKSLVNRLYEQADIVHWMEKFDGENTLFSRDYNKPIVLHHHGTLLREQPAYYRTGVERKAIQLASTVDLLRWGRDIRWMPNPYNNEWLKSFREPRPSGRSVLELFHSPTNRAIKGTAELIAATQGSETINLTVSEFKPWVENLRLKGYSDAYYDCPYGLGNNAVEAMGMGIPVIAGMVDSEWANPAVKAKMVEMWGQLPFIEHTRDDLAEVLQEVTLNEDLRRNYSQIGLNHFRNFHDERVVVKMLTDVYNELLQSR